MGNPRLKRILEKKTELDTRYKAWKKAAKLIETRLPAWQTLGALVARLPKLVESAEIKAEYASIIENRNLLAESDPIETLVKRASELLRRELNDRSTTYSDIHKHLSAALALDATWKELSSDDRDRMIREAGIEEPASLNVAGPQEILKALDARSLEAWGDYSAALQGRFDRAKQAAILLLEPKVVPVSLPSRVLKNQADADAWITEAKQLIADALAKGPVSL
jgi:hypothetical protein